MGIDVVLAVGGGSIDCSKVIAAAACYDEVPGTSARPNKINPSPAFIDVLTLSLTGTE